MLAGLLIYLVGQRYLPPEAHRAKRAARRPARAGQDSAATPILLLLAIGLAVDRVPRRL